MSLNKHIKLINFIMFKPIFYFPTNFLSFQFPSQLSFLTTFKVPSEALRLVWFFFFLNLFLRIIFENTKTLFWCSIKIVLIF